MSKAADDLEAVRTVVQALEPFDSKDRDRIIRWACEKLGMAPAGTHRPVPTAEQAVGRSSDTPAQSSVIEEVTATGQGTDIRSFIAAKDPKSDTHLAAVVAYYYHFEAPPSEQRDYITKDDVIDACRKAERERPVRPAQVLVNTYAAGLIDKTGEKAQYRLNSVGENLVAMVLPGGGRLGAARKTGRKPRKHSKKKGNRKKTSQQRTKPKAKRKVKKN